MPPAPTAAGGRAVATPSLLHPGGLTTAAAVQRLHRDGPNRLPEASRPRPWRMFGRQLTQARDRRGGCP